MILNSQKRRLASAALQALKENDMEALRTCLAEGIDANKALGWTRKSLIERALKDRNYAALSGPLFDRIHLDRRYMLEWVGGQNGYPDNGSFYELVTLIHGPKDMGEMEAFAALEVKLAKRYQAEPPKIDMYERTRSREGFLKSLKAGIDYVCAPNVLVRQYMFTSEIQAQHQSRSFVKGEQAIEVVQNIAPGESIRQTFNFEGRGIVVTEKVKTYEKDGALVTETSALDAKDMSEVSARQVRDAADALAEQTGKSVNWRQRPSRQPMG